MLRAGAGLSAHRDGRKAAEEAVAAALACAGSADSAFLFATPGHAEGLPALLDAACGALGSTAVVGASAHGVLAGGREHEGIPAVSVLVQAGLEAELFLLPGLAGDEQAVGAEIAALLGGPPRVGDLVVLLPELSAADPERLLAGIRAALEPARVVGAGAGDPLDGRPLVWCGRQLESDAVAGAVLRGTRPARIGVTQACRPATELLTVTRAQGNWIVELDGRPALDVYSEVARAPLASDLRRAAAFLLVALPCSAAEPLAPGGYRVRNVAGFAVEQRAFATPERIAPGDRIALVLREPEAARDDLKAMLAAIAEPPAALGLYFDCCARGAGFFGVPGLESAYLEHGLGAVPVAGMFGSCEIGPLGAAPGGGWRGDPAGRTELLTYTGVLALVEARDQGAS